MSLFYMPFLVATSLSTKITAPFIAKGAVIGFTVNSCDWQKAYYLTNLQGEAFCLGIQPLFKGVGRRRHSSEATDSSVSGLLQLGEPAGEGDGLTVPLGGVIEFILTTGADLDGSVHGDGG